MTETATEFEARLPRRIDFQVRRPQVGDRLVVLLSDCCSGTMKGVEYGDHMACRKCRQTDVEWIEHEAPFVETVMVEVAEGRMVDVGAGPDYSKAVPLPDIDADLSDLWMWG